MKFDDDIWPQLKASGHTWKYKPRYDGKIVLIELHSTRGGRPENDALDEYHATKGWFLNPNNQFENYRYGACSSVIIGGGRICQVLPDDYWPSFCLGHADPVALAIEIGQSLNWQRFDPRDLELAAEYCAWKSDVYGIPVKVLDYLSVDNHEAPGFVRHDRSANGRVYGKTDPGDNFDDRAFERQVNSYLSPPQEAEMYKLVMQSGAPFVYLVCYDKDGDAIWKRYVKAGAEFEYWKARLPALSVADIKLVPVL